MSQRQNIKMRRDFFFKKKRLSLGEKDENLYAERYSQPQTWARQVNGDSIFLHTLCFHHLFQHLNVVGTIIIINTFVPSVSVCVCVAISYCRKTKLMLWFRWLLLPSVSCPATEDKFIHSVGHTKGLVTLDDGVDKLSTWLLAREESTVSLL